MDLNFKLLKQISETPGAPGFEDRIRNLIIKQLKGLVDKITIDNLGNIVAYKKGKEKKKVMIAAHMDEIGFIINHIDENGFLRFYPLGGFDPKTLTAQRVIIHGKKDITGVMGSKPIHIMKEEEKKKPLEISDFFIDVGMKKKEVEKIVEIGNPVTRERECIEMGECINGKSLDNRISVFILIEALKLIKGKTLPYDIYAVFTTQEEVGIRGAQVSTLEIQPNFGFAIDTTIAFDVPGSQPHEQITKMGEGVAIKIMDASVITDSRIVSFMKKVANENKIKWQPELMSKGGTDTAGLQRMTKSGSIAGAISIPTRHIHQVIESVNKDDVLSAIQLLSKCLENINKFDYKY